MMQIKSVTTEIQIVMRLKKGTRYLDLAVPAHVLQDGTIRMGADVAKAAIALLEDGARDGMPPVRDMDVAGHA
jgi:hypothetical protein